MLITIINNSNERIMSYVQAIGKKVFRNKKK